MKKPLVYFLGKGLRRILSYERLVEISSQVNLPLAPPLTANISITSRCALRCKYCEVWKYQGKTQDLHPEQFGRILASAKNLGVRILTITGGEPLLHGELQRIIAISRKHQMRVHIITKGSLLTNDRAAELVRSGVNCIVLSLDTFDAEIYRYLTGTSFESAERALKSLLYVKEKDQDLDVAVNCVINRYNIGTLAYFARRVTEYGNGKILINFQPYQRCGLRIKDELVPSKEMYPILVKEIDELIELKRRNLPLINSVQFLRRIPEFLVFNKMPKGFKCKAGFVGIYICDNLDVRPCYQLPPLGNLNGENLERIWFSEEFGKQRGSMKVGRCRGCLLTCHNDETRYDWYNRIDKNGRLQCRARARNKIPAAVGKVESRLGKSCKQESAVEK